MTKKINRPHRGAPPGNRRARKHGFYSKKVDLKPGDSLAFDDPLTEVNHNLAIARYKLKSLLENDSDNVSLIAYTLSLSNRLVRTKELLLRKRSRVTRRATCKLGRALSITPKTEHARQPPI